MKFLRIMFRIPAALLWTTLIHFCWVRVAQIFHPGKRAVDPGHVWGRGLALIMGIRLHKVNECPLPLGDVIISNHMGFLDIPIMLSCFPAVFIIKIEMRRVFFFGKPLEDQGHVLVDRADMTSRRKASADLTKVIDDGDRIIVFPEGRASPGAKRLPFLPFSFAAVKQLDKNIQSCVIDYLPDRRILEWDVEKPMFGQLVDLFGRRRIDASIEFFPAEKVDNPRQMARDYRKRTQERLETHDRERKTAE